MLYVCKYSSFFVFWYSFNLCMDWNKKLIGGLINMCVRNSSCALLFLFAIL